MKRFIKVMFVVGSAALLFATTAQAQTVTSTSDPLAAPPVAAVDITLTGNIQSSIVLAVSSTAGNVLSAVNNQNMSAARASATFAFGNFNTQQATALANGSLSRAGAGAFAVAALSARVTITGSANNGSVLMSPVADAVGSETSTMSGLGPCAMT